MSRCVINKVINKVIIANRGEIALRILRTCAHMGIETVAAHSDADEEAMHVKLADSSICIGAGDPKMSYLNAFGVLAAAYVSGADALHPGYGFLSENAQFAELVAEAGMIFIGPRPEHIRLMGNKVQAKATMRRLGVPVIPGSASTINALSDADVIELANGIGYPLLLKASSGGGGRGMRLVRSQGELFEQISYAKQEAMHGFGDPSIYMEKYLTSPRHIEIQIAGDKYANVVHLGERDCSVQRRYQKIIEETPSTAITQEERQEITSTIVKAMQSLEYESIGTVEMLYQDGCFYFMEMNTRLQVEHTVTEMVTGIDLVRLQLEIASGKKLPFQQKDMQFTGHSMQCRVNCEDPDNMMLPCPGKIINYHPPTGPFVRVDSSMYAGYTVPSLYDSLIAKVITWGQNRQQARLRMLCYLGEYIIEGDCRHNLKLLQAILVQEDFINASYDIKWLEKHMHSLLRVNI